MWALGRILVLLRRSETLEADAIAWKEGTQMKRLSKERCKDAACSWVKLLSDDGVQSSSGELHRDGLQASCQLCARHQESYALSKTRRACSVEGCEKVAQTVKGGDKLCRLHASKEERGPAVKPGNFASRSQGLPEARKRSISRGAERARPHSQDATPKPSTQTEAAELRGISSPPRLDGATSAASLPGVDASVEDQVLSGLTWEEIAGIPDEDLRKRAIFLKQKGTMPGPTSSGPSRSTPRTEEPDENQALFAYLEARLQGKGHDSAVEVSAVGGRTPSERQQRLRDLARRHCLRLTSELPAEAGKFVWELAQPQASPEEQPGGRFYPWSASDPGPPPYHQSRASPWAASAPDRPWAASAPDHRPTAQALFRSSPGSGGPGGRTDAVDALAQATRAFRAGAFTDAEAPAADETTKALQAIAKSLTAKEDSLAQERGKLASIGRLEERLVFLLRGCDTLSVTLCPGVVGKELFHALRIAGTQARPQLRKIEFPCNIQNRHSYGFAALQMGGKTLSTLPEYCLSAGDFPLISEEDFDNYGGSPDLKLERKGRYPNTLTSWFRAALRQSWAFAWEQHGYAWPASAVYGAWEELWARFCEEARELDRRIRRAMQDETPTFARLKFFALSPGPDGQPWLQLPGTFRLDDDTQYFCTDMLPRMQRQLSRACWAGAQKKSSAGGRAAGEGDNTEARTEPGAPLPSKGGRAGGEAADKAAPPKLLGPSLTPKEAARSLDHRPKDQQGQYLCWDFLTHRGCNKGNGCPHSHKAAPKWTMLDYTVQLQLLRRGGLKGAKARTADEVDREFTRVRAEQAAKTAAAKQEGIAAAKAKASATQRTGQAASASNADRTSRAGQRVPEPAGHVVADLDDVLPTDREETLGALLKNEGNNWWKDVDAAAATLTCPSSAFEGLARAEAMQAVDAAEPALPHRLGGRLLTQPPSGHAPELDDVTQLLEEAVSLGGPELSEEAAHLLEERGLQLSGLTWNSSIGAGTLTWKGVGHWAMYDYQDQLPLSPEACERMGFADVRDEPKQCLLLHVAAAYLGKSGQPLPTPESVWALAAEWRVRWCSQARVAEDSLGPAPERLTQAEADVRVFHHDLLHFGHDRDYRTLVAHPFEEWDCLGLAVLRLDAYMRPSVEVVCGSRYSGKAEDTVGASAPWPYAYLEEAKVLRYLTPGASCSARSVTLSVFGLQVLRAGGGHPVEARTGPALGAAAPAAPTSSADWGGLLPLAAPGRVADGSTRRRVVLRFAVGRRPVADGRALRAGGSEWHDTSSFRSLALMDDSVVIEPDLGLRPQLSVHALEEAIRQTLGPLAINAAKDVEEGALSTRKLIWGLEFDTEAGTCRLPPLKVERAYHVLQSPHFDAGQTKVSYHNLPHTSRAPMRFWGQLTERATLSYAGTRLSSPHTQEAAPAAEQAAPGDQEAVKYEAPGDEEETLAGASEAPQGGSASAPAAPGEGDTQAIWGPKVEEGGPLQPLVDAAQALGEVALAEPEAIALKVDPDTLTAEIAKLSLEDEDPDWSGDEAEIQVTTALPGEAASSSSKQEEGVGTKKEIEHDETEEPAPRRRKVVLATGQLSLLRALAAANASNWSGVQQALREAQGSGEEKSELVENLTSLAQAFSKNRDACAQAATSRAAALAELEGCVLRGTPTGLGGVGTKKPREAQHGAGAGAQHLVRDQADAATHLNFQMNEAVKDSLRRFQEELRSGELDTPMRAAVAQKRKPESERRRRIKWAKSCEKQGKTRKYDPTESEQNHPYAHSESLHLERARPGRCPTGESGDPWYCGEWQPLASAQPGPTSPSLWDKGGEEPAAPHPLSKPPLTRPWIAATRVLGLLALALLPVLANAAERDLVEEGEDWGLWTSRFLTAGCLYLAWRMTLGWGVETKEVACQTTQGHPPAADHVRVMPAGECFHAEHSGHLRARKSRAYRPAWTAPRLSPALPRNRQQGRPLRPDVWGLTLRDSSG
ncbi:unnamed protein product [Symbiodinium sp. CCMP2592]|nr:unnamed protein product [Symbiodinium sp. CCMP2592]